MKANLEHSRLRYNKATFLFLLYKYECVCVLGVSDSLAI